MRRFILTAMAVVLAVSAALAEEMVENPQYKSWAKFKPDTVVKMQANSVTKAQGMEIASRMSMTTTLKSLTADKAVLQIVTEMEVNGRKMTMPAQTQEAPAKVAKGSSTTQPAGVTVTKVAEGDEEITVAGKTYKCHWVQNKMSSARMEATSKVWNCDKIPGGMAKMVTNTTKPMTATTTMEVLEIKPAS